MKKQKPAPKSKKPAPKWMRERFDLGKGKTHSDAMNEGMRRAAKRED